MSKPLDQMTWQEIELGGVLRTPAGPGNTRRRLALPASGVDQKPLYPLRRLLDRLS